MIPSRSDCLFHAMIGALVALLAIACGAESTPMQPLDELLDRAAVIDALEYWKSAAGIDYEIIDANSQPRILIRSGTDGLAPQGGGRAGIDGTEPMDNRARSGLVVFEPGGGDYCELGTAAVCRYLYRHEIGHALGFLAHSDSGLMNRTPDALTERERRMVTALYSLPHGAIVQEDGTWSVPASGASGILNDVQAARDIIDWNMNAQGGASYRQLGVITRWDVPVRVHIAN